MNTDNPNTPEPAQSHADPANSLERMPRDELVTLGAELGLSPEPDATSAELAGTISQRRELLDRLDRQGMLEVVAWGRRPVKESAGKEELAREISQISKMHFAGLSREGLYVLACLRGARVQPDASAAGIIRALKDHESLLEKFRRKRRRWVGKLVSRLIGEQVQEQYQFLPEDKRGPSLKDRIEERGLVQGLADRLRGAADDYIATKLDEIEKRIDSKLDEIDRRLAEWRDREIANRLRIIKITLWASVIVALLSLAYALATKYIFN